MFVQVIRGKVADETTLRSAMERWERELAPGVEGFLGSTGGVTDDGILIELTQFESAEAAQSNSERPEQSAWWDEASKSFDGEVVFYDCPIVDEHMAADPQGAGFVQVSICRVSDVAAARKFGAQFAEMARQVRPDLLGFIDAYTDDVCVTMSYFSTEAEAKEAEKREMPPEHQTVFQGFRSLVRDYESFDLRDPRSFGTG